VSSQLRRHGVVYAAVFGSLARGEANEGSDVDVVIDFDPNEETYGNLLAVADMLESALGGSVDLVTRSGLSQFVAPCVSQEARSAGILDHGTTATHTS
jgi:hypothetical protein